MPWLLNEDEMATAAADDDVDDVCRIAAEELQDEIREAKKRPAGCATILGDVIFETLFEL